MLFHGEYLNSRSSDAFLVRLSESPAAIPAQIYALRRPRLSERILNPMV